MNTIVSIEKVIKKIPRGKIFFVDSIYKKYPIKLVQRVLLRLAKSNEVGTICGPATIFCNNLIYLV